METELRAVLAANGTSDRALEPILGWLLEQHLTNFQVRLVVAEIWRAPVHPATLRERLEIALQLHECDLLLGHRDAEAQGPETRRREIESAIRSLDSAPRWIAVIPVRMMEAWLLIDERALRTAAGNPNGGEPLDLPRPRDRVFRRTNHIASRQPARQRPAQLGQHQQMEFGPLPGLEERVHPGEGRRHGCIIPPVSRPARGAAVRND
jgi:hypothetical protein